MNAFITILLVLTTFATLSEFTTFATVGWFTPKGIRNKFIGLDVTKMRLNRYNTRILYLTEHTWVTNTFISILSKYYIEGLGTIPRWSKLHKEINRYYAEMYAQK